MTYVPVPKDERKGHGRTPLDIPESLIAQLQHSRATGAKCYIMLDGTEDPADVAELKRALVRAGYRHFSENTIEKRFRQHMIQFWVGPKKSRAQKPVDGGTE